MKGALRRRDLLLNSPTIIKEYGFKFYIYLIKYMIMNRNGTFLDCLSRWNKFAR